MLSTQDKIKHLSWRSGFGLSPTEWKKTANQSLTFYLDNIFTKAEKSARQAIPDYDNGDLATFKKMSPEERKQALKKRKELLRTINADWVGRMADPSESALLEKMCLFWHGHFACITKSASLAAKQLMTIRQHALGNFRSFVHAIAKDVSMIRFLNNQQNKKKQPNENFARELLELFTIGRGHYSEQDIKEAARAFTGWSSDLKGDFIFRRRQHDYGVKSFMGKTGAFDGGDIVDIILDHKETARFITRKIYRFFINEKINEGRLQRLADRLYRSDYDIKDLMYHIFSSDWFYEKENIGAQIKSPVVLLAGIMRILGVQFEGAEPILFVERALGQILFIPPNVAGWSEGKNWIDNSTLMLRLNLVGYLFKATDMDFKVKEEFEAQKRNKAVRKIKAELDLKPLLRLPADDDEQSVFDALSQFLLQVNPRVDLSTLLPHLDHSTTRSLVESVTLRLMTLPEYQVC